MGEHILDYQETISNVEKYYISYNKEEINISVADIIKNIYSKFYEFLCSFFMDIYKRIIILKNDIDSDISLKGKFNIRMLDEMEKIKKMINDKTLIQLDELHNNLQELLKFIKNKQIFEYYNQDPKTVFEKIKVIEDYITNYNYDEINKDFIQQFKQLYLINYKRALIIKNYFNFTFDQDIVSQINKNIHQTLNIYSQNKQFTLQDIDKIQSQITVINKNYIDYTTYYLNFTNNIIENYKTTIFEDKFLNNIKTTKNYNYVYLESFNLNIFIYTVYTLLLEFNTNIITTKKLHYELNRIKACLNTYCKIYNNFYDKFISKIDSSLITNIHKIENINI